MESAVETKQAQFRLPLWVHSYLAQRAGERNETKTQVVIEAVSCLRQREIEARMAEGYQEYAELARHVSEQALPVATEVLGEW
jgi:hypothetical protein